MVLFTLSLVRHGETKANKERIIQGQSDIPLSETGLVQASCVALRLRNEKFTHIYSSDLSRAYKTAETVAEKNCVMDQNTEIHLDERLRERKFGNVEGKTVNEMRQLAKESGASFIHFNPKGAETVENVRKRAILFFNELCESFIKTETEGREVNKLANNVSNLCDCWSQLSIQNDAKTFIETIKSSNNDFEFPETIKDPIVENNFDDSTLSQDCKLNQIKSKCNCNEKHVANVLIVSHGGFIRELIKYFVDELHCSLPGGKVQASLITPNTGLSVFKVLVNSKKVLKVMCLDIHNQNHLLNVALFNEEAV